MAALRSLAAAGMLIFIGTGATLAQSVGAAPSGGASTGRSVIGPETPVEKKAQSDADKATTICKGC